MKELLEQADEGQSWWDESFPEDPRWILASKDDQDELEEEEFIDDEGEEEDFDEDDDDEFDDEFEDEDEDEDEDLFDDDEDEDEPLFDDDDEEDEQDVL